MDRLILKNTKSEYVYVNDLGAGVAPGEDLNLITNYRDEDILESTDLQDVLDSGDLEVWLNDSTQMSYQNVVDYLTKLTRYDVIDFNYVSNEDSETDVTSQEIEQLTDGSDTELHIHDNRYYTKTELSTPNQATIHWDNIIDAPMGDSIIIQNGQLYVYDSNRDKTLGISEQNYTYSSKAADGRFLDVGDNFGFDSGYIVPYSAIITRITLSASGGYSGKVIEIRKNNTTILHSITMADSIEYFNDLDININEGDNLQVFASSGGGAIRRVICNVYIREKI
ncbi:MAG: hypothetical protein ACOCQD_02900 [archaeon]